MSAGKSQQVKGKSKGFITSWQPGKGGKMGRSFEDEHEGEEALGEQEASASKDENNVDDSKGEAGEETQEEELYYRGAKNLASMFEQKKEDPKPKKKFVMDVERGPAKVYENEPVAAVNPGVVRSSDPVPFIVDNEKGFIKNIANQILTSAEKDKEPKPREKRIVVNRNEGGIILENNPQAPPPDVVRHDDSSGIVQVESGHIRNLLHQFLVKEDEDEPVKPENNTPAWILELEAAKKPAAKGQSGKTPETADITANNTEKSAKDQKSNKDARSQRGGAGLIGKDGSSAEKPAGVHKLGKEFPPQKIGDQKSGKTEQQQLGKSTGKDQHQGQDQKGGGKGAAQTSLVVMKDGKKVSLPGLNDKAGAGKLADGKIQTNAVEEKKDDSRAAGVKAKFPPAAAAADINKGAAGKTSAAPVRHSLYK